MTNINGFDFSVVDGDSVRISHDDLSWRDIIVDADNIAAIRAAVGSSCDVDIFNGDSSLNGVRDGYVSYVAIDNRFDLMDADWDYSSDISAGDMIAGLDSVI